MSARQLITEHLDLWTGAVTKKSSSGRGSNGKVELTGVKKLRELILELALSGRLVEPEPDEEPAQSLLAKIEAEKARLTAQGLIKKPKKLAEAGDSQPYSLPPHWCWVQLGSVTNYGTTDKAEPKQVADNTWVLELEDIEKESSRLLNKVRYTERQFKSSKNRFERGDVLYGKLRPYLDKVLVADEPGVCTTEIIPIRGYLGLLPEFLRLALKSPSFKLYANDSTHGMNLPRLGTDKARLAMIPLAPEQEQHRIVQKVDELMALCDRLEQQTSGQLEAHETLVDTLLGTLTQSENATELADNWARLAAHFDTLFTTEQSIDKLKQAVLQLAVMGRLVEQDPDDEPASVLLERIAEEKARLIKEGKIKKPKKLPEVAEEEKSFEAPPNWAFTRVTELYDLQNGYAFKSGWFSHSGIKLLRNINISHGVIDWSECALLPESMASEYQRFSLRSGDLVISLDRPLISTGLKYSVVKEKDLPCLLLQRVARFQSYSDTVITRYLEYWLNSAMFTSSIDPGRSNGVPHISTGQIGKVVFPLPPKDEQHRIVDKVDELMALCDQLKARLGEAGETRTQLAEAVVASALG